MAMLLGIAQKDQPLGVTLREKWELFWEKLEPYGFGDTNIPRHERPVVLNSKEWGFNLQLVIRPRAGTLDFASYPIGEDSRAFWSFAGLIPLGFVDRVRLCPNCRQFFFAKRKDSMLCSQRCRESAWRKSDAGRDARAAYMRRYRANARERARNAAPKGYVRKRGRKLHVDLKKGE